jgi:hypothetical protein
MATFELVDGDWTKEHVWKYTLKEKIDRFLIAAGYDSKHF